MDEITARKNLVATLLSCNDITILFAMVTVIILFKNTFRLMPNNNVPFDRSIRLY